MEECYLHQPHSALDGHSPYESYQSDPHEIRMLEASVIADAFLSCEKRKVDKSGCISFDGRKYEVELGLSMIHRSVDVIYDPADISIISVECEGFPACQAKPLVIQSHSAAKPKLPEHYEKTVAASSRLLEAAEGKYEDRLKQRRTAISFSGMKGGEADV